MLLFIHLTPPLHCSDSPELGQIVTSGVGGRVRFSSTTQVEFKEQSVPKENRGALSEAGRMETPPRGPPRKFPTHRESFLSTAGFQQQHICMVADTLPSAVKQKELHWGLKSPLATFMLLHRVKS